MVRRVLNLFFDTILGVKVGGVIAATASAAIATVLASGGEYNASEFFYNLLQNGVAIVGGWVIIYLTLYVFAGAGKLITNMSLPPLFAVFRCVNSQLSSGESLFVDVCNSEELEDATGVSVEISNLTYEGWDERGNREIADALFHRDKNLIWADGKTEASIDRRSCLPIMIANVEHTRLALNLRDSSGIGRLPALPQGKYRAYIRYSADTPRKYAYGFAVINFGFDDMGIGGVTIDDKFFDPTLRQEAKKQFWRKLLITGLD